MATVMQEKEKETRARPWYRRDPWLDRLPRPLARLERDFEQLMERFFGGAAEPYAGRCAFVPSVNLAETEHQFEVDVELPGVTRDDVRVELRHGDLWISGKKQEEQEEAGKTYHRVEHCVGEFHRVIPLPGAVDEERIEARYENGILRITLPKTEEAQPKHIEVKF